MTEEILIEKIKSVGSLVNPPESLLRSILSESNWPKATPRAGKIPSPFWFRFAVTSFAVLFIVLVGGFSYNRVQNSTAINPTPNLNTQSDVVSVLPADSSNNSLDQDLNIVDTQLKTLDADIAKI